MKGMLTARYIFPFMGIISLSAIALHTTASLLSYAGLIEYPYAFAGVGRLALPFGDLAQLTYTAGCKSPISALATGSETCDPSSRPFNLMFPALFLFKLFQLDQSRHLSVGGTIGIASIMSLIYFASQLKKELKTSSKITYIGVIAASYPMQLALERGNTDLVILITLVLFAISFHRYLLSRASLWLYVASLISGFSILFKLWAGPAMLVVFSLESFRSLRKPNLHHRFRPIALITTLLGALFVVTYFGSEHVFKHTEVWEGYVSFGINASYYHPSIAEPGLMKGAIRAWKVTVFVGSAAFWMRKTMPLEAILKEETPLVSSSALQLGFFTYLSVYLLSQSWDYRLICLALILPWFLRKRDSGYRSSSIPLLMAVLILFELYIPVDWALGLAGSLSDFIIQPALIGILLIEVIRTYCVSVSSQ